MSDIIEANKKLTFAQRTADQLTAFCGSWSFIIFCSAFCGLWFLLNSTLMIFGVWDAYPYIALNLVLTVVSTLQGPIIMMSQNRQTERDRQTVEEIKGMLKEVLRRLN